MNIIARNVPRQYLRNGDLNLAEGGVAYYSTGIGGVTGGYLPALPLEEGGYLVEDQVTFQENVLMKEDLTVEGDVNIEGNTDISGDLTVDGNIDLTGNITINGEAFEGGGIDQESAEKIDQLVDMYKEMSYQYSVYNTDSTYMGFIVVVNFPEKDYWNYDNEWQVRGDIQIYSSGFDAKYFVYATGTLSEAGELTINRCSCFGIGERCAAVLKVTKNFGKLDNSAASIAFSVRAPYGKRSAAFSKFDVSAFKDGGYYEATLNGKEYPSSEVSGVEVGHNGNPGIPLPTPDEDYYGVYVSYHTIIPITRMASKLSDLGVTATAEEINILDGALITTTELNSLQGINNNIQDSIDDIQEQLKLKYDYLTINVPNTPEQGHIFFDHDGELVYSIDNPPIYQSPIPDSWDEYTKLDITVGSEITGVDAFYGICMEFEDDQWPDSAEIWVKHNEIWGRVYLSEGSWYADKNAAEWLDNVGYAHTAGATGYGYVDLYTESVGLEFKTQSTSFGEYEVYAKASGMVNVSYRETMPYFNLVCTYTHSAYNITDEVFISDDFYLTNDKTVHKLFTSESIDFYIKDTITKWTEPFMSRLSIVEGQLNDIELALDDILGYETTTYLEETLDEILYQ